MNAFTHVLNELDQKVREAIGARSLTSSKGFQILAMSSFKWLNNRVKCHPNSVEMAFLPKNCKNSPAVGSFRPLTPSVKGR